MSKQYSKYKPSGIDWIGEIPSHWDLKKLKYLAKIMNGQDHKTVWDENGKYPIVGTGGEFGKANQYLHNRPSVILGRKGTIDKPQFWDTPFWTVDTAYYTNIPAHTNPRFFFYCCKTILFDLYKYGSAVPSMTQETLNQIKFATPPLTEQTAIASFLDEKIAQIDKLISNKQKLIELLKEERIATINEAVNGKGKNWEKKKLKYVAYLRDELIDTSDFKIAVENIESASGRLVNMGEDKNYEGQLSAFKKGDTIFNKLRPYLHKVYLAEKDGGLYGELLIVYSMDELIPEFLFFKLFSKEFIDIVDGSTQGTKMPRANWNDFISQLLISFPKDKKEQAIIVKLIQTETERIDHTISKIEKEIELMEEYRTTLISEVVTGKLKVTEN